MCAILKFDKEPSQEFHEYLYARPLALRLIYTVYNSFSFSPLLGRCFVYSASFFLFPGFSDKHFLCCFVFSSQKIEQCSFTKLFLISSVLAVPVQPDASGPPSSEQLVGDALGLFPPSPLIPSKQGYGLNVLPKSL